MGSTPEPQDQPSAARTSDVTQLLDEAAAGSTLATDRLLPLVYDELHRMARAEMGRERPGQTLQPTALVHEAYLRLVGDSTLPSDGPAWRSRGHFFGAAAQAMRRILVERARSRGRLKRGGGRHRVELNSDGLAQQPERDDLLAIDEVLSQLEGHDPRKAQVVMLRFFGGLTIEQTAMALGLTPSQAKDEWSFARAWMHRELSRHGAAPPG
jgi:RNA polymerase sigma factor (TIGR02999 family)